MTDRSDAVWQAASLLHQYGPEEGRAQGARIDMQLDAYGWTEAERIIKAGRYVCQSCPNKGLGDHLESEQ